MPTTAPPAGRRAGTGSPARPRVDATLQASLNSCAFPSPAIKPGRGPRTRAGGRPPIHGADVWCARAGHGAGMGAGAGGAPRLQSSPQSSSWLCPRGAHADVSDVDPDGRTGEVGGGSDQKSRRATGSSGGSVLRGAVLFSGGLLPAGGSPSRLQAPDCSERPRQWPVRGERGAPAF